MAPIRVVAPLAESEYISVERAARILHIGIASVYRLRSRCDEYGRPFIEMLDYGHGMHKRIAYDSVVRFCDRLRECYAIRDRRPPLGPNLSRWRDSDLLPFPIDDTIGLREATDCLGYLSLSPVLKLVEEGRFEAYRLLPDPGCPWRISRSDFARWLETRRGTVH